MDQGAKARSEDNGFRQFRRSKERWSLRLSRAARDKVSGWKNLVRTPGRRERDRSAALAIQ